MEFCDAHSENINLLPYGDSSIKFPVSEIKSNPNPVSSRLSRDQHTEKVRPEDR